MEFNILNNYFYQRDTVPLALALLGTLLIHESTEGITSGFIIETEAYLSKNDPACHAYRGKTKRNAAMFGPPGRAYVYFIYGNHHCFNVVSAAEGIGEAVLVRALEPVDGVELMKERRGKHHKVENLTSGPGKLCSAMNISREHNGISLQKPPLYLAKGKTVEKSSIDTSGRIGINQAQDKPLRFFLKNNLFLSR